MSRTANDGTIVELREPIDYEAGELEMKPGTTQDERDMERLGKTQHFFSHAF
jgi:hypothetical protein